MLKKKYIVTGDLKIIDRIKLFNSKNKSVLIVNSNKQLIGSLSEGDIRRSLLKGNKLTSKISKIYNKKPFHLTIGNFNIKKIK